MNNFIKISELIPRLEQYKSYMHKFTSHSIIPAWYGKDIFPYKKYPNAVLGYQALQHVKEIPLYIKNNPKKRPLRQLDELDRLIISSRLGLIIDLSRMSCVVGFEINPHDKDLKVPFIPLNKAIAVFKDMGYKGQIKPGSGFYLDYLPGKTDRILTCVTDDLSYPIIWHISDKGENGLLTKDESFEVLKKICAFLDENGWVPFRERSNNAVPNQKDSIIIAKE